MKTEDPFDFGAMRLCSGRTVLVSGRCLTLLARAKESD